MVYGKQKYHNILLVAITRLGDMLQASPTILGLKQENPGAKITVLIEKSFASICEGIPGIDQIYPIDLNYLCRCMHRENEGIVEAYQRISEILEDLKSKEFDYCLNMSSSGYTALLLKMLGIKESRGWVSDDEGHRLITNPWAMLFAAFVFHSNRDYNSINLVDIFRCSAGVTAHPKSLQYQISAKDQDFADQFLLQEELAGEGPLICLQAGASQPKRQWAPERFARLIKSLVEDLGARVILTGTESEKLIIATTLSFYQHPRVKVAAGKTNLGQLASLLKKADVMITGDTGPMHLAVAVGTPVVALFLASALCFETGPYSEGNLVIQPMISCNPCNPNFPCARPDCHDQITPELVTYLTKLRLELSNKELESIRLPASVAPGNRVGIYLTKFDQDQFLEFMQINESSSRNGFSIEYYNSARAAYRHLWKEELAAVPVKELPKLNTVELKGKSRLGFHASPEHSLEQIISLTHQGQSYLDQLLTLINDRNSSPKLLGEVGQALDKVDKDIEKVGLGFPMLGALCRMFIMDKENMRGNDPVILASETKKLYQTLAARCGKFGYLFRYYENEMRG